LLSEKRGKNSDGRPCSFFFRKATLWRFFNFEKSADTDTARESKDNNEYYCTLVRREIGKE